MADYQNPYIDQSGFALSPEAIAARRRFAYGLMQQAGSGEPTKANAIGALARALQGTMAGYMVGQSDKAEQQGISSQGQMLADMVSGGGSQSASPQASASPVQSAQPMGNIPAGKIYDANEPSPLDPPSGNARDLLVRTIYGEDPGKSALGVANVVRNRAVSGQFGGDTVPGVVLAKNQFEPWNNNMARSRMAALQPGSPEYNRLGGIVDQTYTGANDPTAGATSFYSPTAQAALGRPTPQWAQGQGQDIGEHRFYGGAPGQPAQLAGPPPSPDSGSPQMQQPQPPPGVPQQDAGVPQGGIQKLISVVRDPTANPYQKQYATRMLEGIVQKQMSGGMKYIPQADGSTAWFNEFNPSQHGVIPADPGMAARVGALDQAKATGTATGTAQTNIAFGPQTTALKGQEAYQTAAGTEAGRQAAASGATMNNDVMAAVPGKIQSALSALDSPSLTPITGVSGARMAAIAGTPANNHRELLNEIESAYTSNYINAIRAKYPERLIPAEQVEQYKQSLGLKTFDDKQLRNALLQLQNGGAPGSNAPVNMTPGGGLFTPRPANAGEATSGGFTSRLLKVTPPNGR
jgi:hypothetical protein